MAHIPYGYRITGGVAVPNPDQQRCLLSLFDYCRAGFSQKASMDLSGIGCSYRRCRAMLRNRTYLGTDFYPQLIGRELFDAVQAELDGRPEHKHGTNRKHRNRPVQTAFTLLPGEGDLYDRIREVEHGS